MLPICSQLAMIAVPVIVVFTKFDALDDEAYEALANEGLLHQDAVMQAPTRAMEDFEKNHKNLPIFKSHYPPKAYVTLRGMSFGDQKVGTLKKKTFSKQT